MLIVAKQNFREEIVGPRPVVVLLWAKWCGPCKALKPIVEMIEQEYAGRLKVLSIDVDENPDLERELGITGVPTTLLFKDGVKVHSIVGAVPKITLESIIERLLPGLTTKS